jgi:hypothetical protein
MTRPLFSGLLITILLLSSVSFAADRPNIVLMISDDQAWYGTSVQMHPEMQNSKSDFYQTPRLEELATTRPRPFVRRPARACRRA